MGRIKQVSTDVLIIGSGGAGLRAAIEARRQRMKVLLISKSMTGVATCTACSMGAFTISHDHKGIVKHFHKTLDEGRLLNNPNLVRILVTKAWSAVKELETFGVKLSVEKDKAVIATEIRPAGVILSKVLTNRALSLGVNFVENAVVFDLAVEGNRCIGAFAFKKDTGEVVAISARAVILATGGYARLYVRNDNPRTTTGDGLILAYNAGAELQDLEFIQFQPAFIDAGVPRMPVLDWLIEATKNFVPGGPLVNNVGEHFLGKYGLLDRKISRDNLIVAVERELLRKKSADYVILDLTSLSPEEIEAAFDLEFQKRLVRPFKQILSKRMLRIASSAHSTMGGIRINEKCETGVEGLYAVGEVTGGIHGANRLGGNALTEIVVFGQIAGQQAAEHAKHTRLNMIEKEQIAKGKGILHELCNKAKPQKINPSLIKKHITSVVSKFCKPVRSGKGLLLALEKLKQIEEEGTPFMFSNNLDQLREAVEANFMLQLAKFIATSALARNESRGSHFRMDYPLSDDKNWLKNTIVTQEKGTTRIRYEPVQVASFSS
ncbi:MAG: FAD-binding protein [Candidatus Bathyarchaeia archaeon]